MGGTGSGRCEERTVAEDCLRLDIAQFKRWEWIGKNCLTRNKYFWYEDDKPVASAMVDVITHRGEKPRVVVRMGTLQQTIALASTKPAYGGRRWWFRCPSGRRCQILYLSDSRSQFLSRQAARITYYSKRLGGADRVRWRAQKLRRKLPGAHHGHYPNRPLGMRRQRYDQIVEELQELDAQITEQWHAFLSREVKK